VKTWKADLALVGNTIIWGATFVLVKDALADVSPMLFLALRFALAAVVLALLYGRKVQRASLRDGAIAGVLLFLGYLFQTTGLLYTTPSKSAFYTSLSIPMVPLLGSLVYRSAPRWNEVAGIAVASTGMILLTTEGSRVAWDRGSLLSFFCAVAFAGHIVAVGKFSDRANFETLAVMQILTAAVLAGVSFRLIDTVKLRWTGPVVAAVLVTALLATALAFTIQAWAQQHTTATRTALIYTLEPVWACVTSWLLRGERLSGVAWVGGLLILVGVLLVEVKRSAGQKHQSIRVVSPEV
jgi:drug/metabolite transporter (DMT)-like permease